MAFVHLQGAQIKHSCLTGILEYAKPDDLLPFFTFFSSPSLQSYSVPSKQISHLSSAICKLLAVSTSLLFFLYLPKTFHFFFQIPSKYHWHQFNILSMSNPRNDISIFLKKNYNKNYRLAFLLPLLLFTIIYSLFNCSVYLCRWSYHYSS